MDRCIERLEVISKSMDGVNQQMLTGISTKLLNLRRSLHKNSDVVRSRAVLEGILPFIDGFLKDPVPSKLPDLYFKVINFPFTFFILQSLHSSKPSRPKFSPIESTASPTEIINSEDTFENISPENRRPRIAHVTTAVHIPLTPEPFTPKRAKLAKRKSKLEVLKRKLRRTGR